MLSGLMTAAGSGGSGVYRIDHVQARYLRLAWDPLMLVYMASKICAGWTLGVQDMIPKEDAPGQCF